MAEKTPNLYSQLPDDTLSSEEESIPEHLKATPEEWIYGTVPGSCIATTIALMHSKAQANPIVPRSTKMKSKKFKKKKTTMTLIPKTSATQSTQSTICGIL